MVHDRKASLNPQFSEPRISSLARSRATGSSPSAFPGSCQSRRRRAIFSSKSSVARWLPAAALFTICLIITCVWRIADFGEISNSPHTVPLSSRRGNGGNQSVARHAEHAFGRSYRARICRPARKARWAGASLGSVLLLFCPALLHRFRELLPARSSEPATSLGRRGLTGSLAHRPLCPAPFHRL